MLSWASVDVVCAIPIMAAQFWTCSFALSSSTGCSTFDRQYEHWLPWRYLGNEIQHSAMNAVGEIIAIDYVPASRAISAIICHMKRTKLPRWIPRTDPRGVKRLQNISSFHSRIGLQDSILIYMCYIDVVLYSMSVTCRVHKETRLGSECSSLQLIATGQR